MSWNRPTKPPREQRIAERAARNAAQAQTCLPRRAAVVGGGTVGPAPKPVPWRSPTLLDMARNQPCLLLVPGICNHRTDTTVAAHSNWGEHGKAKGRKADDCYSAWCCAACHTWLDQGCAPAGQKRAAFMAAHARQVLAWRQIATDPTEPARYRRAALAALERLGATAFGAAP
jgi:hypothetical protein